MKTPKAFTLKRNGFCFSFTPQEMSNSAELLILREHEQVSRFQKEIDDLVFHPSLAANPESSCIKLHSLMTSLTAVCTDIINFRHTWTYWRLNCVVTLDVPEYKHIVLLEDSIIELDDIQFFIESSELLVVELLPRAFGSLIQNCPPEIDIDRLEISVRNKPDEIQTLYDYMIEHAATVFYFSSPEELKTEDIRKWVEDTMSMDIVDREEFDDPGMLGAIHTHAEAILNLHQSKNIKI